ncbi:hypothetical protein J1614_007897 [Plenodomus biglobosus]|nr:hypothetical protein J1614_007897 [Plenodomus biglobosus]
MTWCWQTQLTVEGIGKPGKGSAKNSCAKWNRLDKPQVMGSCFRAKAGHGHACSSLRIQSGAQAGKSGLLVQVLRS